MEINVGKGDVVISKAKKDLISDCVETTGIKAQIAYDKVDSVIEEDDLQPGVLASALIDLVSEYQNQINNLVELVALLATSNETNIELDDVMRLFLKKKAYEGLSDMFESLIEDEDFEIEIDNGLVS